MSVCVVVCVCVSDVYVNTDAVGICGIGICLCTYVSACVWVHVCKCMCMKVHVCVSVSVIGVSMYMCTVKVPLVPFHNSSPSERETCSFLGIWEQTTFFQFFFSFTILLQLRWPMEPKFSQICYAMHMMGYTEWEDWSLTMDECALRQKLWVCF